MCAVTRKIGRAKRRSTSRATSARAVFRPIAELPWQEPIPDQTMVLIRSPICEMEILILPPAFRYVGRIMHIRPRPDCPSR